MIAIDTNVILRYLLQDDIAQTKKAHALITGDELILISNVVLVETIWTLCGKKYRLKHEDVVRTLHALFEEKNIIFENAVTVWRALSDFQAVNKDSAGKIEFSDALILHIGKQTADRFEMEFNGFYTFDEAAQQLLEALAP